LAEVSAEERIGREIELVGNLLDGHFGSTKQGLGLNDYMLPNVFHRKFTG
jgi:hypothetical protein